MASTPRCKFPYPDETANPWFDIFESFVEAIDLTLYTTREDRNIVVFGGGTMTWNSGTGVLAWASDIFLMSSVTGYRWQLPTGNVTLADGQMAYMTVTRAPQTQQVVSLVVGTSTPNEPNGDSQILFVVRNGTRVHFREGFVMNNGDSRLIFDQSTGGGTGGGAVPAGSTSQLQYNAAGSFGAASNLTYDGTNLILLTALKFKSGAFFGSLQMTPTAARTLTLPDTTDTLIGRATTDTLTNKSINASNNSISDTGAAAGDLLKHNGSKFAKFAKGAANRVPAVNSGGTDLAYILIADANVSATAAIAGTKLAAATNAVQGAVLLQGDLGGDGTTGAAPKVANVTGVSGLALVGANNVRNNSTSKVVIDTAIASVGTTDATPTVIKSWTLAASRYYSIRAVVTVVGVAVGDYAEYSVKAGYTQVGGTVTEVHKTITPDVESNGALNVTLVINGTAVELKGVGIAATTLQWQVHELIQEAAVP